MNSDYEKKLEARIDTELKGLEDLPAPATLTSRVMRTLERRSMRPWYQRSWATWPRGLQIASFASLALLFGGLFVSAWMLMNSGVGQESGELFGSAATLFKVIDVLHSALVLAVRQLGTAVIAGFILMLAFVWVACIGIGTAYVRLGMQPAVNRR